MGDPLFRTARNMRHNLDSTLELGFLLRGRLHRRLSSSTSLRSAVHPL